MSRMSENDMALNDACRALEIFKHLVMMGSKMCAQKRGYHQMCVYEAAWDLLGMCGEFPHINYQLRRTVMGSHDVVIHLLQEGCDLATQQSLFTCCQL